MSDVRCQMADGRWQGGAGQGRAGQGSWLTRRVSFGVALFVLRAEGSTHPLPVPKGTGLVTPNDFEA